MAGLHCKRHWAQATVPFTAGQVNRRGEGKVGNVFDQILGGLETCKIVIIGIKLGKEATYHWEAVRLGAGAQVSDNPQEILGGTAQAESCPPKERCCPGFCPTFVRGGAFVTTIGGVSQGLLPALLPWWGCQFPY